MKRKRYSEEQIVRVWEEASSGTPVTEVCRKYNISNPTFYEWKKKYGGMSASEVRELERVPFLLYLERVLYEGEEPH